MPKAVDDYDFEDQEGEGEGEGQAAEESAKPPAPAKETYADKVNSVVAKMVKAEDGSWTLPAEVESSLDEAMLHAVRTERRYRDTQASYTASRQQLKALETTNEELTNHVIANATLHLTDEQREELDDLRTSDPDAWRAKLNDYEVQAKELQRSKVKEFADKGKAASEAELRVQAYEQFKNETGIELSDQVIENQLPASYLKKLNAGAWTFEEFLSEAKKFLAPGDVKIKGANAPGDKPKDMSKMSGGSAPSAEAQEGASGQDYSKEVY